MKQSWCARAHLLNEFPQNEKIKIGIAASMTIVFFPLEKKFFYFFSCLIVVNKRKDGELRASATVKNNGEHSSRFEEMRRACESNNNKDTQNHYHVHVLQ